MQGNIFSNLMQKIDMRLNPKKYQDQVDTYNRAVEVRHAIAQGQMPNTNKNSNYVYSGLLSNVNRAAPQRVKTTPSPTPTAPIAASPSPTPYIIPETPDQYRSTIVKSAVENGVPPVLLSAVLQHESGFNPNAQSPVGAVGIAQFMPETAQGMGFDPKDPTQAIPAAARYLAQKYKQHGNRWDLALAAYNAGSGNVQKYGGIPPFPETQRYVSNLMKYVR